MGKPLHRVTFDELYSKWISQVGDPDKNLFVSPTRNAMSWRMGFFYLARVMVVDVLKVPPPVNPGKSLILLYGPDLVIEITANRILN